MSRMFHRDRTLPQGAGWIFVFGSNLAGRHGAGAAKAAAEHFGAQYGCGVGLTGRAYALPTKDSRIQTLPFVDVAQNVQEFVDFAEANPELKFFVTRVGCELAGFSNGQIAPLFAAAPVNCSFAEEWRPWVERLAEAPTRFPRMVR